MDVHHDECMFCKETLPGAAQDEPVNLAFMAHLDDHGPCQERFEVWTDNMATDFLGD